MRIIGKHKTRVSTIDKVTVVRYHNTDIFRWDRETAAVTLNSGGWNTVTTKRRMNQASCQFGLGFHVVQKDFEWYVRLRGGGVYDFHDGMLFLCWPED